MYCSKCGQELTDNCDLCPECGNKMRKKMGSGKIVAILLLVVVIVCMGVGVFFFGLRNAQRTETIVVENKENSTDMDEQSESEIIVEEVEEVKEVDEMEEFFLSLSFEALEMTMGEIHQIQLEKKMTDAVWVSSDEKIVQVTDGVIKALTPGTATITVSLDENQKFFDVVVNTFPDTTLAVNCSKAIELNDAITNVRWESSVPEIVSVSEGTISSLSAGASVITAYIDEVPYSFEVVATTPDISTTSVRKIIGNSQQISILGTNGQVEWKSDNTAVATVSETGLITVEPTGAGQSTVVHAYVDGMEFKIDVEAEPIPQLSSTYKMYGYQNDSTYKNAKIVVCANANEIWDAGIWRNSSGHLSHLSDVLNVADVDYSSGTIYPVYRTFNSYGDKMAGNYAEIYLIGTSQKANVLVQNIWVNDEGVGYGTTDAEVTYEAKDGYGVIRVYGANYSNTILTTVEVDGYTYQFVVEREDDFDYAYIDKLSPNYVIEECSVDEVITHKATDSSGLVANSRTYHTNNDWIERVGTKFVQELEDQAIEIAAGVVLKLILPF